MVLEVLNRCPKGWDQIISNVFAIFCFSQCKQRSLHDFEATLPAGYSTVPSKGCVTEHCSKNILCYKFLLIGLCFEAEDSEILLFLDFNSGFCIALVTREFKMENKSPWDGL